MKAFISEYGKVIIVAIVIMALLGVANFFADDGTEKFKDMLNTYVSTANGEEDSEYSFTADEYHYSIKSQAGSGLLLCCSKSRA